MKSVVYNIHRRPKTETPTPRNELNWWRLRNARIDIVMQPGYVWGSITYQPSCWVTRLLGFDRTARKYKWRK